jgi:hypothetical protein
MSDVNHEMARQRNEAHALDNYYALQELEMRVKDLATWLCQEREKRKKAYETLCLVSDVKDIAILVDEVFFSTLEKMVQFEMVTKEEAGL